MLIRFIYSSPSSNQTYAFRFAGICLSFAHFSCWITLYSDMKMFRKSHSLCPASARGCFYSLSLLSADQNPNAHEFQCAHSVRTESNTTFITTWCTRAFMLCACVCDRISNCSMGFVSNSVVMLFIFISRALQNFMFSRAVVVLNNELCVGKI